MATALAASPAAKADTFTFEFSGSGPTCSGCTDNVTFSGSGTLTGDPISGQPGSFEITSATGNMWVNGIEDSINHLILNPNWPLNAGKAEFYNGATDLITYDDVLTPHTTPVLDGNGLAFILDSGAAVGISLDYPGSQTIVWDEFIYTAPSHWLIVNDPGGDPSNFQITPEPSSLMLLGTGLLLMAGGLFRKFMSVTV